MIKKQREKIKLLIDFIAFISVVAIVYIIVPWFAIVVALVWGVIFAAHLLYFLLHTNNPNWNIDKTNISIQKLENIVELRKEPAQASYFYSIQNFSNAHGDEKKILELEKSLQTLESFVYYSFKNDKELPPYVPCRDVLPELYMRCGDWNKAEQVIRLCMSIRAYGYTDYSKSKRGIWFSATGEDELSTLQKRSDVSVAVLQYLSENPGTLQRNVYKIPELSYCDHDALVWFCRYSHQIRKEKESNTNRLYAVSELTM